MKVLNKHQRRQALGKIIALFGVLTILITFCGYSLKRATNDIGIGQIKYLKDSLESARNYYDSALISLKNDSMAYLDTLRELSSANDLSELEDEIIELEEELMNEEDKVKEILDNISDYERALDDCLSSKNNTTDL